MRHDYQYAPETGVSDQFVEHSQAREGGPEGSARLFTQHVGDAGHGGHGGGGGQFRHLFWIMLGLAVLDVLRPLLRPLLQVADRCRRRCVAPITGAPPSRGHVQAKKTRLLLKKVPGTGYPKRGVSIRHEHRFRPRGVAQR